MLSRRQGHVEQALLYLLAADKAGSRNPMTHAEMALSYEQLNHLEEAIAELEQALPLSPNVEALHFFFGELYRHAGGVENATKEFAEAAKLLGTRPQRWRSERRSESVTRTTIRLC